MATLDDILLQGPVVLDARRSINKEEQLKIQPTYLLD